MTAARPWVGSALSWWSVTAAVASLEGARLLRHPLLLAATLLSALYAVTIAGALDAGGRYLVLLGPTLLPLAVATLLLANAAALRSRRSGTEELLGAAPAPGTARTVAHLLALAWPVGLSAVLVATAFVAFGAWDGVVVDAEGHRRTVTPTGLAQGPAAVAALGALGVALARWVPHPAAGALTALATLVFAMPYALWEFRAAHGWFMPLVNPARTASTEASWPCSTAQDAACRLDVLLTGSLGWHVLYLAAMAGVLAGTALLRQRASRGVGAVTAAALVAALVAGWRQVP